MVGLNSLKFISISMFSEMMVAVNVNYVVIMFALALVIVYCLMLNDVDE